MPLDLQVGVRGVKEGVIAFRGLGLRVGVKFRGSSWILKDLPVLISFIQVKKVGSLGG